jgi:hypothetical protein
MKTGKTGAIIYYKHLKILEEAMLSDEQIGQILKGAIKYDETGAAPQFQSPLSAFFTMIKYDLDANREKWQEISDARKEAGKKGGRPKKPKEANGNEKSKKSNRFSEGAIVEAAKSSGFYIDMATAKRFRDSGLDHEWLHGKYSFLGFAAERIQENYGDKPTGEQKALFIDAVRNWDELREEYPQWKLKKEKKEKKAAVNKAREDHPKNCIHCGGELGFTDNGYACKACMKICHLNEETVEWEWEDWK